VSYIFSAVKNFRELTMASKVAFIKHETNWLAVIPRIIILTLFIFIFYSAHIRSFYLYGAFAQILFSRSIKLMLMPRSVYTSTELIGQAEFNKTIPFLDNSIEYFNKHAWIDQYRILLMISSSKGSIKESLICNKAVCLLRNGNVKESKALYNRVLEEFPHSNLASSMLNIINSVERPIDRACIPSTTDH
jgi:hypothetical protein